MRLKELVLVLGFLFLSACSGGGDAKPQVREFGIKGDPLEIVRGATMAPSSPFEASNIEDLNNYAFFQMFVFSEKENKQENKKDLKQEQAPPDKLANVSYHLRVKEVSKDRAVVAIQNVNLQMVFAEESGRLQIKSLLGDGGEIPVKVLHWSLTANASHLSVLLQVDSASEGRSLVALYFRNDKIREGFIKSIQGAYRYLAGVGVGIGWDAQKTLLVKACGADVEETYFKSAVNTWSEALGDRLDIESARATSFAPFNDLNQNCVYSVNVYDNSPESYNFGVTTPVLDLRTGDIVDSDILIFKKAFEKHREDIKKYSEKETGSVNREWVDNIISKYKTVTYVHEMGHLLGLAHQFDGTKSIMSYDFDTLTLTPYDRAAIQTLYSKTPSSEYKKSKK